MKHFGTLAAALALSACASSPPASPSYVIHNPELFATERPKVDDDGIPLVFPGDETAPATKAAHWFEGNGRMVD